MASSTTGRRSSRVGSGWFCQEVASQPRHSRVVMPEDGVAVAVLHAVNERGRHLAPAIGDDRIGADHAHERGLARASDMESTAACRHRRRSAWRNRRSAACRCPARGARSSRYATVRGRSAASAAVELLGVVLRRPHAEAGAPGRSRWARPAPRWRACSHCPARRNRRWA